MDKELDIRIDDYLKDKLSMEERTKFEAELVSNGALKKELDFRKSISEEFELYELQQVKTRFNSIQKELEAGKTGGNNWIKYLGLFLAAALILTASYFLLNKSNESTVSTPKQFASYFEPYDMQVQKRGDINPDLIQLNAYYDEKNYAAALESLNKIILENTEPKWKLYRGICQFQLGEYTSALKSFVDVQNADDVLIKDQGTWYAALCFLQLNDMSSAKEKLLLLSKDKDSDHYRESNAILRALND